MWWFTFMLKHPKLYSILEWGSLALSIGAFCLSLYYFLTVKGWI